MSINLAMKKLIALILLAIPLATPAQADTASDKQWQLGIGLGSVYGPDYRGADEYRSFSSLIPYIVYRGKFIKSDREGVKAQFFSSDKIDFSLSASAYISPDSDKNKRREAMPSLGSTIELGPAINVRLTGSDLQQGWQLQLPWRAVFALGGGSNQMIGSVLQPQLVYLDKFSSWSLRYRSGLVFGSNDYHDYYYTVAPQYARADRPQFDARRGYSGFTSDLALSRELGIQGINTRLALFLRYDNLQDVKFSQSPLLMSDHVLRSGIAFVWVIR